MTRDDVPTADRPWARRNPHPDGGMVFSPAPTTSTTGADSPDPFGMFTDPSTNFLTQIIKQQLGTLGSAPPTEATSSWLMNFLGDQLRKTSGAGPADFSVHNPYLDQYATQAEKRIQELQAYPFSNQEEDAMRARTRNDVATQRDQTRERIMEDASRRGVGQSSGVVGAEIANAEGTATAQDAKNQNDLLMFEMDQIRQRKDQAANISQQLAAAGQGDAAMQMQGKIASENANTNRQGQIMGIATALAQMAAQQRGEARARQGDVLQLATLLAELPVQRLQLAASLLNGSGGGNVQSLFQDVLGLNNAQQGAQNQQNAAQSQFLSALTALASYFANRK